MTVSSGAEAAPAIAVRHLSTREEYDRCCELEETVWGGGDRDLVPSTIFAVAKETGGQVLGAFADDVMIGFTHALVGFHDLPGGREAYLHSHMTAVLPEYRDQGVGRLLKLFQRQDALGRGIRLVEWTFDPLESRNAHFNLMSLGAVVRKFRANFYGITSSHLHAGMPTDRLVAEWWIDSRHAKRVITEAAPTRARTLNAQRILVPKQMPEWRMNDVSRAIAGQTRIREQFVQWLATGYIATAFETTPEGGQYILEPYAEVKDEL